MKQEATLERFVFCGKYLPEEIIKEILLRLDVKSLRRFECVCKSWQNLIRQPSFVNNHFKRQPSSVIFYHSSTKKCGGDCDFIVSLYSNDGREIRTCKEFPDSLFPVGCDNGLFCFVNFETNDICLRNPATTEFKTLPSPPSTCREQNHVYLHGLGYDSITDDFKVVRVCGKDDMSFKLFRSDDFVSVYSLRSNSWKRMQMFDMVSSSSTSVSDLSSGMWSYIAHQWRSVVVNGSIHWQLDIKRDHDNDQNVNSILAFDLSTEVFKLINLPELGDYKYVGFMGKLSECLSLVVKKGMLESVFEIWMMKEYGVLDSWVKQVQVDYQTYPLKSLIPAPRTDYFPYPLAFGNNGKLLLMDPLNHRVFWYDLESHKVKLMCTLLSIEFAFTTAENVIHI